MHKKVDDIKIDGFALTSAVPRQQVQILMKDWATSESPHFYVYMEQIANIIFPKYDSINLRDSINQFLAVIHPDNTADIYAQDFEMIAKIKVNRTVQKGEPIYIKDIDEIAEIRFPNVLINNNDRVIFLLRGGWRFGILFDFTRKIDTDVLAVDIAKLHKKLVLEDVLKNALSKIQANIAQDDLKSDAHIITEGKTDWMHLEKAFEKLDYQRNLSYSKLNKDLGKDGLLDICKKAIHLPAHQKPVICIFDRDDKKIEKELANQSGRENAEYQSWGCNVFSMVLPYPANREKYKNICIEMYYPDDVIMRLTDDGKRLFFDNELKVEVDPMHIKKMIQIPPVSEIEYDKKIHSKDVELIENSSGKKIGISKTVFAELIYKELCPFKDINFENFRSVSDVIEKIIIAQNIF